MNSVVVELPFAVTTPGLATNSESERLTPPGVNVTDTVSVTLPTLAVTLFVSAFVDVSVALNVPSAAVTPLALVSVVCPAVNRFPLPLAVTVTLFPLSAFPLASVTVAVIVVDVVPSATTVLGLAVTESCVCAVVACLNVTAVVSSAVCAVPTVNVTLSLCATLDVSVAASTPPAFVAPVTVAPLVSPLPANVFPLPLALNVTAWFPIGFPFASFSSAIKLVVPPTVSDAGLTCSDDVLALAAPATNVTAVALFAPPATADTSFVSAFVDASVAVNTPLALVFPVAVAPVVLPTVNVFPLPLALNVTAWLCTGDPFESVTVAVIVAVLVPSAVTLVALVATATEIAPVVALTNDTPLVNSADCAEPTVAETVSLCAALDVSEPIKMPLSFVFAVSVLPLVAPLALNVFPLPLADNVTAWFATGLPFASTSSSKICVLPPTVRLAGLVCSEEPLATAAPAVKSTAAELLTRPASAVTTLVPATVDASVAVNTPLLFVVPLALVPVLCPYANVLPAPLAVSVTL